MNYELDIRELSVEGYEKVVNFSCEEVSLDAVIAIHSTHRGPALGGVRMLPYSSFEEGLQDVLRLSQGMTYKAALAGLQLGGGKSVIFAPSGSFDREHLMLAFAQAVESLEGLYICAEDMGTTCKDMEIIRKVTTHVVGLEAISGDPSYYTSYGVFLCIKAASALLGKSSLREVTIAIQGLGMVGFKLAERLFWEGASLIVSDIDPKVELLARKRFGAQVVSSEDVYKVPCDIFAPCARGGVINTNSIKELKCQAIVGAANNQLEKKELAEDLYSRGILYIPDYLANAGGLINVANELGAYNPQKVLFALDHIPQTFEKLYRCSLEKKSSLEKVASELVSSLI